jgi:hypothetical protein
MTKKRGARIRILVEDELLGRFARKTLESLRYHPREIRLVSGYPRTGQGSAKQWVDGKYPQEVKIYRQRKNSQNVALLVGTDADNLTVVQRSGNLGQALSVAGLPPRADEEQIVHWIPRWSIETWGIALTGQTVAEETPYKDTSQAKDIDWKAAASAFVEDYRKPPADRVTSLPSLVAAYDETDRLK